MLLQTAIDLTQQSSIHSEVVGPFTSTSTGITLILQAIMVLAALMVLIFLIWGAVEWITSGGDKGKVEASRNKITQAVIGIFVLAASVALFTLIQHILGINLHLDETNSGSGSPSISINCVPHSACTGSGKVCVTGVCPDINQCSCQSTQ